MKGKIAPRDRDGIIISGCAKIKSQPWQLAVSNGETSGGSMGRIHGHDDA